MRYIVTMILVILLCSSVVISGTLKGTVRDTDSGSPLIGANVILVGTAMGATTDEDGAFVILDIPDGDYTVEISYLGYQQVEELVTIAADETTLSLELTPIALTGEAITIVSNRAKFRETPVAFTNMEKAEIVENLGSRDVPLVLNTTPGVYATAQGGGAGDARINIRGFDQRNVAVMINGVPVNDMENGWVYWSNWDGLGDVTSSIQVQRGLGASNLAIASVGGTLNILTDAASQDRGISAKQEIGAGGFFKSTVNASTGLMDNGLAVTVAGVRKFGNGVVDQTWSDAWAYFGTISYQMNRDHRIELYGVGAPQRHGHRLYEQNIETFDAKYAREIYEDQNLPEASIESAIAGAGNYGGNYNFNWGPIFNFDAAGMTEYYNGGTHEFSDRAIYMDGQEVSGGSVVMERENFYHKPQVNLNWYWNASDNTFLSTVLYYSKGIGGGTGLKGWPGTISDDDATYGQFGGQLNFQGAYDWNSVQIDSSFSTSETKSSTVVRNSVNQHTWFGTLITAEHRLNSDVKITAGVDARDYTGEHWREVRNLLGGDYYLDFDDAHQSTPMKGLGDKIDYHNDGKTRWLGGFAQVEGRMGDLTIVGSGSFSQTRYQRIDYFADTSVPNVLPTESDWQNFNGGTFKLGANYNVNSQINVFANAGLYSKAPIFDAVFDFSHTLYENITNEQIRAFEGGSSYRTQRSQTDVNVYYTKWEDRSWSRSVPSNNPDAPNIFFLLQGLDARHMGLEVNWNFRVNKYFDVRSAISIGDWVWLDNVETTYAPEEDPTNLSTFFVYSDGLKVGDAAQKSLALGGNFRPIEGLRIGGTMRAYGDHYANFDPSDRTDENDNTQPWRIPNYSLVDMSVTYDLPVDLGGVDLQLFGFIFNLFDENYIADANDGSSHTALDAQVYFGLERRFNAGLQVHFK